MYKINASGGENTITEAQETFIPMDVEFNVDT